jgi:hypothetical protein
MGLPRPRKLRYGARPWRQGKIVGGVEVEKG